MIPMRTQEFWVLDDDDREVVERLAVGLSETAARVLAYLLLRRERAEIPDAPATQLTVRIGTGMNRKAVTDALSRLEERSLVSVTTARDGGRGRPPKAWYAPDGLETTVDRVYEQHAAELLDRSSTVLDRETERPEPAGEPEASAVTVGLNWRPNGLHVPFYVTVGSEAEESAGLSVDVTHYRGSRRALDAVASGDADVGVAGAATIARAREVGRPVVPIAILYQRAMTALYTTRTAFGEPLLAVDQLRGRRIGTPAGSETDVLCRLFVSQTAIAETIRFVDTGGEEQKALRSGAVDVVTGSFSDPRQLELEGSTVDSILVADHFPIYGPTLVVHEETLLERTALLGRFLERTMRVWADARRRPDDAVRAIAAASNESPEEVRRTFEQAVEEFAATEAVRDHGWGWQRVEMWDRIETALRQGELLHETA
jgi:ABC-type nitrate/sulfonate/bicarbonate transport system substrate-binding protein/predicted transcriptional regulator